MKHIFHALSSLFLAVVTMVSTPLLADESFFRAHLASPIYFTPQSAFSVTLSPPLPDRVDRGASYTGTLSVNGAEAPYTTDIRGMLPDGLSLDGNTISGVFTANGSYRVSFTALDTQNASGWTNDFNIEVVDPIDLEYASFNLVARTNTQASLPAPTVTGNLSSYSIDIVSGSLPSGMEVDANGAISGTPLVSGSGMLTLVARDGEERSSPQRTVVWTVYPELSASQASMTVGEAVPFVSSDPQISGQYGEVSWSIETGTLPDGMILDPVTGRILGSAAPGAQSATGIRLRATDALGGTISEPFDVAVANAIVKSIGADTTHVNLQALFDESEWTSPAPKLVRIEPDVTIGSTSNGTPALQTGTGWSSTLTIHNLGRIEGRGGNPNGGNGGDAILLSDNDVSLINEGFIGAGGGGGGRGGNGGNGSEIQSIGTFSGWVTRSSGNCRVYSGKTSIYWKGSLVASSPNRKPGYDGYFWGFNYYECGAVYDTWSGYTYKQIRRAPVTSSRAQGGNGGSGGSGQGYQSGPINGMTGSAGNNGAGTGGLGGDGGDWGETGATGNNGGNGNSGTGAAGAIGGQPGMAISGARHLYSIADTGTVIGETRH